MGQTTMKDVAKHAGVSVMTVSRVINNSGPVRPETRKRVEETIGELTYLPNKTAQRLASMRIKESADE